MAGIQAYFFYISPTYRFLMRLLHTGKDFIGLLQLGKDREQSVVALLGTGPLSSSGLLFTHDDDDDV